MTTPDPYTAEARLCDNTGMISDERVTPGAPGTLLAQKLTYRQLLNNLRSHTSLAPYTGKPIRCTGSAHLAGEHFRCTSPAHNTTHAGASYLRDYAQAMTLQLATVDATDPAHNTAVATVHAAQTAADALATNPADPVAQAVIDLLQTMATPQAVTATLTTHSTAT